MKFSQMRERFAVEFDALFLGGANEFAVRKAERTQGGVDFDIPQSAEVAFLVATMGESVTAGMGERFIGGALGLGAAETEAFGLAQNIPAILESVNCFFDSGHGIG